MDIARQAGAPVIETERTILRAHRMSDFDAYAEMWADPLVTRHISGKPRTREESWLRFLRNAGLWSLLGYGFWAVEEKASGRFIGEAGFHDMKRDMQPSIEGVPEAGWAFAPLAHGRGLATEVVSRLLAWGDEAFGRGRIVCIIAPENTASLGVALKCGFDEILRTHYHDAPTVLLERRPG
ncbi:MULTISPECIES: GNAT family N-acetyltransferase [unclassified Mesorhizobium]|uniref:GNAT family N-acetyltransferase n=1 Tax=unclassified Mesorhizobium TaxID=325217 RepID=UPI000962C7CD|nr:MULTISPECIES: GNAT family N-acetyltransferase [unclassified Mesorhizobium]MBN9258791.1 GNAT family N-acetyltransferase [Mesorhizobium sp.]MBN9274320.1 GNAT family N-acetyltransferase [Mesorhizobium sp.]OJX71552.1 MAG: GNAT family N-acetyltransferase [Mesorhizobium sp. 65-26]